MNIGKKKSTSFDITKYHLGFHLYEKKLENVQNQSTLFSLLLLHFPSTTQLELTSHLPPLFNISESLRDYFIFEWWFLKMSKNVSIVNDRKKSHHQYHIEYHIRSTSATLCCKICCNTRGFSSSFWILLMRDSANSRCSRCLTCASYLTQLSRTCLASAA